MPGRQRGRRLAGRPRHRLVAGSPSRVAARAVCEHLSRPQVTRDDTLINAYLDHAKLTPAEIASFPHGNVLLRVLGFPPEADAAITSLVVRPGDVLLLCTDGIHGLVNDTGSPPSLRGSTIRRLEQG
jgi:serine/threonine protein phosphatase PrpC